MKKKLLICIPSLRLGGAAKIALNLCEYYAQNNTEVHLLLTGTAGSEVTFSGIPDGIKLISLPQPKLNRWLQLLYKVGWLMMYFRKERPDSILAVRHDATALSSMAWKMAGKPGAFYIREINPITRTLNRKKLMVKLLQSAYAAADGIIANSKDVVHALKQKNWVEGSRIHVIDNPVLSQAFFAKAAEEVEEEWLSDARVPLIITIGRLQRMKDHETLIRAFKIVKKKVDCRLMVIGEGEEFGNLQQLIDELGLSASARLAGGIENPYPYLRRADLFVLTSRYEGFGNVLVEALSQGKRIVATDCTGGPAYILNYGEFGTLATVGAIEEIANAILNNLNSVPDKAKLIQRAMDFTVEVVGEKYSKVMFKGIKEL